MAQTLFHNNNIFNAQINDLESELERRTVTYTLWNQSAATNMEKGWHPFTFTYANASPKQINEIKVRMKPSTYLFVPFNYVSFLYSNDSLVVS